jgi:SynChlorMet cassette protein ScmD
MGEDIMSGKKPVVANTQIVFREEFDDWAVLFDPDTGDSFGMSPVSAFIWKHLDGKHTLDDILAEMRKCCKEVPDEADEHMKTFVEELISKGYAGYERCT